MSASSSEEGDLNEIITPSTVEMDILVENVNKIQTTKTRHIQRPATQKTPKQSPNTQLKRLSLRPTMNVQQSPPKVLKTPTPPPVNIRSIDEIVKMHAPLLNVETQASKEAERLAHTRIISDNSSVNRTLASSPSPSNSPSMTDTRSELDADRPTIKSISDIIKEHSHSLSSKHSEGFDYDDSDNDDEQDIQIDIEGFQPRDEKRNGIYKPSYTHSSYSVHSNSKSPSSSTRTPSINKPPMIDKPYEDEFDIDTVPSLASKSWIAQYLRSPRLTRLIKLQRFPHNGLQVSLADVGKKDGNPVLVFLGLGCTRHLISLYSDLANTLNLRLICVDRWGLGRTGPSSSDKRGLIEWANVIVEILDVLAIKRVALLAHSAGTPYALALAYIAPNRILEPVQLLAPWVQPSASPKSNWKWLKHVPNGVLKAAQAAEWRVAGWSIGKPPQLKYEGVENKQSDDEVIDEFAYLDQADGFDESVFERSHSQPNVQTLSAAQAPQRSSSTQNLKRSRKVSLNNSTRSGQDTNSDEKQVSVGSALLAASHAESQSGGGTAHDLMLILNRGSKPWGFDYRDITARVHMYWGDRDDRISYEAVKWMEDNMVSCKLQHLPGKNHSLLTDPIVIADVLENLAEKYNNRIKDQQKKTTN